MKIDYQVNLKLLEVLIMHRNHARLHGNLSLKDSSESLSNDLALPLKQLINLAVQLMAEGRPPKFILFLMNEYYEMYAYEHQSDINVLKDLRFTIYFLSNFYEGNVDYHTFFEAISDQALKIELKNWSHINMYDIDLKFSDYKEMTNDQIQEIIKSSSYRQFIEKLNTF